MSDANPLAREPLAYDLDDLIELMARLRDPTDGCPWDIAQSYLTIVPSTVEEAYEVADSIERENYDDLKEELGDLLFQTVFYSRLAEEESRFDLRQVISDLVAKLIRRHPHVFPEGTLASRSEIGASETGIKLKWERLKNEERQAKGHQSLMDDIPLNFPALTRAQKVQKRAANIGFDWSAAEQVLPKIEEELAELQIAMQSGDSDSVEDEMGDLLFSCVNLSRKLKIDAEQALRRAIKKFELRFRYIEQAIDNKGLNIDYLSADELEAFWQEAKNSHSV